MPRAEGAGLMDLVGTCPKGFWEEWIAEGDAAGGSMSETLTERMNRHAAELTAEADGLVMPGSRYAARIRRRAGDIQEGAARIGELEAERTRVRTAVARDNEEIMQALGAALHYPRFVDDQKNFPGSTDEDGVCVGDHVAVTLAEEAARKIAELEAAEERLRDAEKVVAAGRAMLGDYIVVGTSGIESVPRFAAELDTYTAKHGGAGDVG